MPASKDVDPDTWVEAVGVRYSLGCRRVLRVYLGKDDWREGPFPIHHDHPRHLNASGYVEIGAMRVYFPHGIQLV